MILAERLGLNYSASAGVITLLSIQDTKKETIRVVVRRLCRCPGTGYLCGMLFRLWLRTPGCLRLSADVFHGLHGVWDEEEFL